MKRTKPRAPRPFRMLDDADLGRVVGGTETTMHEQALVAIRQIKG